MSAFPTTTLRRALALIAVALLLPAASAFALDPANPLEQNNPNNAGNNNGLAPPEWCVPGARITAHGGSHIIPDNPTETNRGSGGMGYTQYDIVAVTDTEVVIQARAYFEPTVDGPNELMSTTSFVTNDFATGGGLWMHPDQIAQTQADPAGNPKITRGPIELDGQTYDAIVFETTTADGRSVTAETFDRATGIRLYQSIRTRTATGRTGSHEQFKTYRVMDLPWLNTNPGPAFADVKKINARGTMTFLSGFAEIPNFVSNLEIESEVVEVKDGLVRLNTVIETTAQGMDPQRGEIANVIAPGTAMGMWIDPEVLAQLEKGQVIDEDTTVGQTVVVSDIIEDSGNTYIILTETGRREAYVMIYGYDLATGLAMGSRLTKPSMNQVIEVEVTGVE